MVYPSDGTPLLGQNEAEIGCCGGCHGLCGRRTGSSTARELTGTCLASQAVLDHDRTSAEGRK